MNRRLPLLLTAALLGSSPVALEAQGGVGQGFLGTAVTQAAVDFPTPGVAEFMAGYVDAPAPVQVEVRSRPPQAQWQLHVHVAVPDMGGYGKPSSDLLWRETGSTAWQPLSTLDQLVATGSGDQVLLIHLRLRLDWTYDEPGTYQVPLTFTAIRP